MGNELAGPFLLMLAVCAVILVVVWLILPFAVIGLKPVVRQVLAAQNETNALLREIRDRLPPRER
jgi:predicted PurR-regulated permease PerM